MTTIIILSGVSGSGKSTWTRNKIEQSPNFVSISRDKIRELLFGYDESTVHLHYSVGNFKEREKLVTSFQTTNIRQAIAQGFDVILDNIHLDTKYIYDVIREFPQCDFEFELIRCELDEAIRRDSVRTRTVGESVIRKQFSQLQNLTKRFDFKPIKSNFVKYVPNTELPSVIICDLDGTIADFHSTRPAFGFEPTLIELDKPIKAVVDVVNCLGMEGCEIIFMSGREDKYLTKTFEWLKLHTSLSQNQIHLFMRNTGDFRKDNIVKKEIFDRVIKDNYNVMFAIDDRNSIVSLWQSLGIFVLNVNQNGQEF